MKIMIVISTLTGGGAERVATVLAGEFVKKGHDVVFASDMTRSDEPLVYNIDQRVKMAKWMKFNKSLNAIGKRMSLKRRFTFGWIIYRFLRSIYRNITQHFRLRKIILNERPDIILGFIQPISFQALVASIGTKSIVVSTEHNSFERPLGARMRPKERFFKFTVNKLFRAVTVLTEADQKVIAHRLKNVYVMPNPLAFNPVNERILLQQRKKQIIAAGRINEWYYKGFDNLIEAWGRIADKCQGWVLNIAGYGEKEVLEYLGKLAADNNVEDSIVFSGFHSDLASLFQESEIFVLSSRYEGFGMVLIEAMSQGCACIACDYKGRQREIIRNDKEGCCIEPENVHKLADAMLRMVKDDAYRQSIRSQAVTRAKDYNASGIADKWLSLCRRLMEIKASEINIRN